MEPASSPARPAVIFAGGEPFTAVENGAVAAEIARWRDAGAIFVAADSGLHRAVALGQRVDLVVGDLDSVDPAVLDDAVHVGGTRVEAHPADKDATDLELAIAAACDAGAPRVLVVGGHGGRLDHLLANLLLLGSPAWGSMEIDALMGDARVLIVRDERAVTGPSGALVTLVALGGPARAVRTTGLRWTLEDEDLLPGSTRGVSNELVSSPATVRVRDGIVAVVVSAAQPSADARVTR